MLFGSNIKTNSLWFWLGVFILAEIFLALAFNFESFNFIILILVALLTFVCVWLRPEFGLYIPLAELTWGSLGHTIGYSYFGLRLTIFLIVIFVFFVKNIFSLKNLIFFKNKKISIVWSLILLAVIIASLIAYFVERPLTGIFLDANAYLYLLYLPVWQEVYRRDYLPTILNIIKAAALVVAIKTLVVFNFFVQSYPGLDMVAIYKWLRDTRTGFVTSFEGSFSRVFLQSQFYVLVAWFLSVWEIIKNHKNKSAFVALIIFSSALYVSLSRSFWLGLIVGFVFLAVNIFIYKRELITTRKFFTLFLVVIGTCLLVELLFNVPKFHSLNIFTQRTIDSGEAAISSREQLLKPLWQGIVKAPIFGQGFGKEISYYSSDPRIKNIDNPSGFYTTYAFEWGWLDMWLKGGLFLVAGFLVYLMLIYRQGYLKLTSNPVALPLLSIVSSLVIIHVFSPYINHPLGLGVLMLSSTILEYDQ